jgi:hypothetical protein
MERTDGSLCNAGGCDHFGAEVKSRGAFFYYQQLARIRDRINHGLRIEG